MYLSYYYINIYDGNILWHNIWDCSKEYTLKNMQTLQNVLAICTVLNSRMTLVNFIWTENNKNQT